MTQTDATNLKLDRAQGKPLIYPRKKLVLRQEKAAGQKILPLTKPILKGKVNTYTMLAVTDDAEDGYAYEVNLDGKYTAIPIPRSLSEANELLGISDDPSMSASSGCPKDPFIDALGNVYNAGGKPPPPLPTGVCELPDGDFVTTDSVVLRRSQRRLQGRWHRGRRLHDPAVPITGIPAVGSHVPRILLDRLRGSHPIVLHR